MFSGRLALCAIVDVGPRHQLVDFAHGMAVGDFVEDVGEPRLRIDIVHLAGFDQRGVDGPISSALVRAGEQMILAPERDRPFILPVSGLRSRFIIAGTRCTADAYGCITARSGTARG